MFLLLIVEVLLDHKSEQGNVTVAFHHANLEPEKQVCVITTKGFEKKGKVLKLKKTSYGLCQSPRAFWKYIVKKMKLCGVPQSEFDPCLFVGQKVICICHVDNAVYLTIVCRKLTRGVL